MLRVVRDHLDACLAVGETHEGDSTGLMDDCLRTLLVRQVVRDGYMTVTFGVDARHVLAEEPTVRGSVAELVDGNVIMNHLMEDGILDEGLGQVDTDVDTENEVLVVHRTKEPRTTTCEGHFAEKTLGMREFDGDRRKLRGEETGIELVKTRLYVVDGRGQMDDV